MPSTSLTSHAFDFAEMAPRWHRSHWDRNWEIVGFWWIWPDLMNFFWLGFVFVFIYWEMILYICLEAEKMWENVRNKKKMCFLYYFQQHNQTLENIFQSIFWNATKHLKIFSFPKNSIFGKYFTWTKHSLSVCLLVFYKKKKIKFEIIFNFEIHWLVVEYLCVMICRLLNIWWEDKFKLYFICRDYEKINYNIWFF